MPTVRHPDPSSYGPLGTTNAGRATRIARQERLDALRYRAAAERLDGDTRRPESAELRSLRAEVRALRDLLGSLRATRRDAR
jgi:hypothetical protein